MEGCLTLAFTKLRMRRSCEFLRVGMRRWRKWTCKTERALPFITLLGSSPVASGLWPKNGKCNGVEYQLTSTHSIMITDAVAIFREAIACNRVRNAQEFRGVCTTQTARTRRLRQRVLHIAHTIARIESG